MSETFEHNPGDHEDPLAGPTWTVGVAGLVFFAVCMLGVAALFYRTMTREQEVKVLAPPTIAVEQLRAEQTARLTAEPHRELRPENPDGTESLVIPLDLAIELTVQDAASASPRNARAR